MTKNKYEFKKFLFLLLCCFISFVGTAQIYPDHFGTGNTIGVRTTSSPVQNGDAIQGTINGTGYYTDAAGLYRFMAQAGFGATAEDIDSLQKMGIENWLDWQMTMPYNTYTDKYFDIKTEVIADLEIIRANAISPKDSFDINMNSYKMYVPMTFWDKAITEKDMLRQKAAFALSQILVVAFTGSVDHYKKANSWTTYYDLLYNDAFGNYRDILYNISLNSIMGVYLNHFQNKKENPDLGTYPDENFAREVMQLFSIGLVELNNDGTPKLDANGNTIPTYDLEDVKQMAKIFTGLLPAETSSPELAWLFRYSPAGYNLSVPMVRFIGVDEDTGDTIDWHDTTEKYILGDTIPANQPDLEDIDDAIDILFNHPNVGPFVSYRLIQQLIKSNPTPEYINRIATVFNNNGNGVRGDMGAVFKAILLDPEARDCEWIDHHKAGKLLQPIERFLNLFKAFDIATPSRRIRFNDSQNTGEKKYLHQAFLSSPSVFNFFSPFYTESEVVGTYDSSMVSPEFQIFTDVSSLHYLNRIRDAVKRLAVHDWISGSGDFTLTNSFKQYQHAPFKNFTAGWTGNSISPNKWVSHPNKEDWPYLNYEEEVNICQDEYNEYQTPDYYDVIDHLDLLLCRGQLNPDVREAINTHLLLAADDDPNYNCGIDISNENSIYGNDEDLHSIVKDAIYFIMISPSYAILK